jgi:hypothetical protein
MADDPQPPRIGPVPTVRPPRRDDVRVPKRRNPPRPVRKAPPRRDPLRRVDEYARGPSY